ncbi:MAG: peptidylprolyl isomerase [Oligoflexia bacterium]|nr:peptidylprolyl isomerase [Oligoflexia bacterium]
MPQSTFQSRLKKNKLAVFALVAASVASVALAATTRELAKVNGAPITDADLRNALTGLNEGQRDSILRDANSRRQILGSLIDQEVLVSEATHEKLDQDENYKEALNAFRKQYLASRVLEKNLGSKLSDAAARKYYESNKTKYSTEQVHAQHILVADEEKAREVLKMAKAPNADFQALAEKVSIDPSAKNNRGDLGYFGRDRMVSEFTDAAFAAGNGEIVGPIKTAYGYHIIKVIDKKAGKPLAYDEVELRVKNELQKQLTENYVGKLRKTAKVEVNEKALDQL